MPPLTEQLPAIIAEAAKSPLGIFALMITSLAILGFFFFRQASERTRIAIFVMLFLGVAAFGLSIARTTGGAAAPAGAGGAGDEQAAPVLGVWTADVTYGPNSTFTESFAFEMIGGRLQATATFLGVERGVFDATIEDHVIRFEVPRQEMSGDETVDVRNIYTGEIRNDRIDFVMQDHRGGRPTRFQARRTAP